MNGGLVPLALLGATIGLMLAFVPGHRAWSALVAYVIAAVLGCAITTGLSPAIIYTALWISAIGTAIRVYLPVARWPVAPALLCLNAGYWLGASAAPSGNCTALVAGVIPVLIVAPAKWLMDRKFDIVIKVVASWIIAIASLSLFVSLIPTPGYKPDHME